MQDSWGCLELRDLRAIEEKWDLMDLLEEEVREELLDPKVLWGQEAQLERVAQLVFRVLQDLLVLEVPKAQRVTED